MDSERIPPPMVQDPAPQARNPYQLFCRYQSAVTANPRNDGSQSSSCPQYYYLPVPEPDLLNDPTFVARLWARTGHQPFNVELVARTPNGGEAVLRKYLQPFEPPIPREGSQFGHLFPPVGLHEHYQGTGIEPVNSSVMRPSNVNGVETPGIGADGFMSSHVMTSNEPIHLNSASTSSYPPHPYLSPVGNQFLNAANVGTPDQPLPYYPAAFMPPPAVSTTSQRRYHNRAPKTHSRQGSRNNPLVLDRPSSRSSSRRATMPALLQTGPPRSSAPLSAGAKLMKAPSRRKSLANNAASQSMVRSPSVIEVVSDSQSESVSSPEADSDSGAAPGDFEMRRWNREALPPEVNRVLDAIKNNYSGDRAGKHPRKPVRIAIFNELRGQGIGGHFGPRGDLLGGSTLRNYTLEQLGMTPKLWNHIDYKFGAGKVGKEMLTKEGGKTSRRIQHRVNAAMRRSRGSDPLDDEESAARRVRRGEWGWEGFGRSVIVAAQSPGGYGGE
ncbi:MAG: hypothetical protein Q9159_004450 [Coniocarpon cinnabarinum]